MSTNRKNLTQQTVTRLKRIISERDLSPGDLLDIEANLEKELGVSRAILREAISRLRALGILDSRQSVGLIVAQPDPVALFEQALEGCATEAMDLPELAGFRYALEVGAASLAVRHATPEQIERLKELAAKFAVDSPPAEPIDNVELAFHRTLLEATHNRILARMHHVIATYFARAAKELPNWDPIHPTEEGVWEHTAIAKALADRNVEHLRSLLSIHIEKLIETSKRAESE